MNSLQGPVRELDGLCRQLSELKVAKPMESRDQSHVREALKNTLLSTHKSMSSVSKAVVGELLERRPELSRQISAFQVEFSWHIEQIKKHAWDELKEQLGSKMQLAFDGATCSFEEFRTKANALIAELTNELGHEFGFSPVGWTICGTSGYNSDVDITIKLVSQPPCIDEAILYKTLRDCIHVYIFGGLSGIQLDTECYPPHVAEINLSQYLYFPMSFCHFQTGEKASVFVQRYLSLHHDVACYERSRQRDLASIKNSAERDAMRLLCCQVEGAMMMLEERVEDAIFELTGLDIPENPKDKKALCRKIRFEKRRVYKEARELAFLPIRVRLAQECKTLQQKIKRESQVLQNITIHTQGFNTKELSGMYRSLDTHHLALQKILIVLASLLDGGTISVSEGRVTLLEEGGQLHSGVLRERKTSMSGFLEGKQEVLEQLSTDPKFRRRASLPLCLTLRREHGVSNTFAKVVLAEDVAEMLKPSFQRPNGQTFLMGAYEESMQLEHMLCDHLDEVPEPGMEAIRAGKYALRVTRNLLQALKEFEKERIVPFGIKSLISRASKLEVISASLEKCKRGSSINTKVATKLLTKVIVQRLSGRGTVDHVEIAAKVQKMFRNFDFGGIYFEKVLPKEQHLDILCSTLKGFKDFFIDVENPQILEILQAHAGFDRFDKNYAHLHRIHEVAVRGTLKYLHLTTADQVRGFLSDVLQLGADVRNMARDNGLFSLTTEAMARGLDLVQIVKNAL